METNFVPHSEHFLVSSATLPGMTQSILTLSILVYYNTNSFFLRSFWLMHLLLVCSSSSIIKVLRLFAWLKQNCFLMDWFYYNLIILIKYCKIPYKNLDKALLFSRDQVFCLKIWKIRRAPTTLRLSISCWKFAHLTYQCLQKGVWSFFIHLDLELFAKI